MKTKYIINSLLAFLMVNQLSKAQDIHFSQYTETPSSINPALAGVHYNTRVISNFRTQWGSVATSYQTIGLSFEQTIKAKKIKGSYFAIALNVFRDAAGDAKLNTLNPNLGISYIQKINKQMKVSGGLQGGLFYRTIDVNNLRWDKQFNGYEYDASLLSGEPATPRSSITSYDVGGGFNFNYAQSEKFFSSKDGNKFDGGFSAYHFTIPANSFIITSEKLYTRYCVYANGDFNIPNSKNAIMPSFLYMRQGPSSQFIVGALFKFILVDQSTYTGFKKPAAISVGSQYRYRDAIVPTVLVQYDVYAFGASYDINVSPLTPASKRNGGLEIMLRYNVSPGYGRNLGRGDTKASY
ncbi:MAG: PorP/SprF family type IX secretion system membrane protein [Bacteroidota bacterium]|nr:PorP/SprF family type IX secretion system membrane protein [Bacteroidota bacterium]MDP3146488.1 PorP/SprF family type IX secretion system membrane protein [Bacteroidota bacterium]MDP3557642.1 PorP/SprF family type IX secretion system membrane protein [Bacteroidota bacterium]